MALPTSKISPLGNYQQQPNQAYITTKPFNGKIFSYSTYVDSNFVTQGTLAANASYSTTANSPAGRVLHANGKFLLSGVNPGVTKYYLGVLDPATGLNGFIDPSDSTFAKYDANLPVQYDLGTQSAVPPLGGQGAKLQAGPVAPFARFTANTQSNNTLASVSVTAGQINTGMVLYGTDVTDAQVVSAYTLGGTSLTFTGSAAGASTAGVNFYAAAHGTLAAPLNTNVGFAVCNETAATTIYTTAVTSSSVILVTQVAAAAAPTDCVVVPSNGSFTITAAADSVWNYVIIN